MNIYYVHVNSGGATFVKEGKFFEDQGGLSEPWGKNWLRIDARNMEEARWAGCTLLGGNPKAVGMTQDACEEE